MKTVILITDYKNRFGTKYTAVPYRSGMDLNLLKEAFHKRSVNVRSVNAAELSAKPELYKDSVFLYTSSEDRDGRYKSFLEDLVLSLEKKGCVVIPQYHLLRGHNNKVFMEMLKQSWGPENGDFLRSLVYGSLDELKMLGCSMKFPLVVKKPEGFKSRNVWLARDNKELLAIASRISRTLNVRDYVFDLLRTFKHAGFTVESQNRGSFLVQQFVPGLKHDYKVLVYGNRYYPLLRENRSNDFRASGSGLLSYPENLPEGLLDFCKKIFTHFNVPSVSLDIAWDGEKYYVLEAQFVYFGTYTLEYSEFWFTDEGLSWEKKYGPSVLEDVYAESVEWYLNKMGLLK